VTDDLDDDGREEPFYLPLQPQSETGKALARGDKPPGGNAADAGTHPWDDSDPIPVVDPKPLQNTIDAVKGGVSDRAKAATNLKVDGFSYAEIADMLEFKDAREAKREIERTLALTHSTDDYETLRILAASRAEDRLRRSTALANADYLVLEDGTKVANDRKLAWHAQSGADLMAWATITGAKAPTKMEITPDLDSINALVDRFATMAGHEEILDAEVIELNAVAPAVRPDFDGEFDDDPA
jgi:hypothetical protein